MDLTLKIHSFYTSRHSSRSDTVRIHNLMCGEGHDHPMRAFKRRLASGRQDQSKRQLSFNVIAR